MNKLIIFIIPLLCFFLVACGDGSSDNDNDKEVVQPPVVITPIAKDWRLISVQQIINNSPVLRITDAAGSIILLDESDNFTSVDDGLFLFNANALKEALNKNKLNDDDMLRVIVENAEPYDSLTSLFSYSDIQNHQQTIFVNILTSFVFDYLDYSNTLTLDKMNDSLSRLFTGYDFQDFNNDNMLDYKDILTYDIYNYNHHLGSLVNRVYSPVKINNTAKEDIINKIINDMPNSLENTPFEIFSQNSSSAELLLRQENDDIFYFISKYCKNNPQVEESFITSGEYTTLNSGCFIEYMTCWTANIDDCGNLNRLYYYQDQVHTVPALLELSQTGKNNSETANKIKIVLLKENTEFMEKLDNIINVTESEEIVIKFKVCQLFREYDAYCEL